MPGSTRTKFAAFLAAAVVLAIGFSACNNGTTTTPTTPTNPTTTDTFTGTLNPNGAKTFQFSTVAAGTLTATLSTVSPDSTVAIGIALGQWNGSACSIVIANDNAVQGAVVTGSASAAGNLCVRVYDVGNLTQNEDITLTVVHP